MALTKTDKTEIKDIVVDALGEFYTEAVSPRMDATDLKLDEIKRRVEKTEIRVEKIERNVSDIHERVEKIESGVSDIHRQVRDLNTDTPSRREFQKHEERIHSLEQVATT